MEYRVRRHFALTFHPSWEDQLNQEFTDETFLKKDWIDSSSQFQLNKLVVLVDHCTILVKFFFKSIIFTKSINNLAKRKVVDKKTPVPNLLFY